MDIGLQPTLQQAVEKGIEAYITSRRARIPVFIDRHFSFRGALALHRKTFGRDFYKHPVNLLWGLPVALGKGVADLLEKAGAKRTATWLNRLPRGIPTVMQRELQWLIYTDLLELPYAQEGRESSRDALMEHILAEPWISALCDEYLTHLHSVAARPEFRRALERHLEEYGKTRGAVSELAGSLINLAAGYAALSKATPGALSAGTAAATAMAQHMAIANFWLGSTVGAWYYAVFPVSASAGLVAATTGAGSTDSSPPWARSCVEAAVAIIGSVITTSRGCSMCWRFCEPPPKRSSRRLFRSVSLNLAYKSLKVSQSCWSAIP